MAAQRREGYDLQIKLLVSRAFGARWCAALLGRIAAQRVAAALYCDVVGVVTTPGPLAVWRCALFSLLLPLRCC